MADSTPRRIIELAQEIISKMKELEVLTDTLDKDNPDKIMYGLFTGNKKYLAVCLNDPFIHCIADTEEDALDGLKRLIMEKYTNSNHSLEGITIPDVLPEDF